MVFNLLNILLHQPYSLMIIGPVLICMASRNWSKKDKGDKAEPKSSQGESPEHEKPEYSSGQKDEKGHSRVALIEEEFIRLGLWKINEAVRRTAARRVAGEVAPDPVTSVDNKAEVADLVTLYQEIKLDEFLRVDFDRLSARDRLQWLKNIVEKPESRFQDVELGMALSGRGGPAVSALLKAYKDKNENLKAYARLKLENVVLTEKSELITRGNVEQLIDELYQLHQISQPYMVSEEKLKGTSTILRSFLFNWGGNVYVLSYQKNGGIMHTLIDTGERRYKPSILKLFKDNGIEPANIERILLTHHHYDHSGLVDILCMVSGARILVHPNFKGESIELDMSRFGKYMEWLAPAKEDHVRNIGGVAFPILGEPVDIGEGAKLEILGLPEGDSLTHTVDQLLFLYTPKNSPGTLKKIGPDFRPTDEIIFSGDLWLMHPPGFFEETMHGFRTSEIITERRRRFDFRPQNRREKDALKAGSALITAKPGHGPEFLGSRIINTLFADRDILVKLGFDENDKKDVLNDPKMALRIKQLKEEAYRNFLDELKLWLNPLEKAGFGYKPDEAAKFLLRIYKEQSGGGELVGQDRKERRIDLRKKLSVLRTDTEQSEELRVAAESALSMIEKIL